MLNTLDECRGWIILWSLQLAPSLSELLILAEANLTPKSIELIDRSLVAFGIDFKTNLARSTLVGEVDQIAAISNQLLTLKHFSRFAAQAITATLERLAKGDRYTRGTSSDGYSPCEAFGKPDL